MAYREATNSESNVGETMLRATMDLSIGMDSSGNFLADAVDHSAAGIPPLISIYDRAVGPTELTDWVDLEIPATFRYRKAPHVRCQLKITNQDEVFSRYGW